MSEDGKSGERKLTKVSSPVISVPSMSDAASLVREERARKAELEKRRKAKLKDEQNVAEPVLEVASGWEGVEAGAIDDNDLAKRQRILQEQLEAKHREAVSQARRLHELQLELKALEEPLKREIFAVRTKLEAEIREESRIVGDVNRLRKELFTAEKSLATVRERKNGLADELVNIMADYEKRKESRLEELAVILGEKSNASNDQSNKNKSDPSFSGF